MTIVCRVQQRLPVTVAVLSGILSGPALTHTLVTLRTCLAEQPTALVLNLAHLNVAAPSALRPLADLIRTARRWPGGPVAVSGASHALRELLTSLTGLREIDYFASTDEALVATLRLPPVARRTIELASNRDAPAAAREEVARACRDWHLLDWQWPTQLIASELVANAVVHARTPSTFTVRRTDEALQVAVRDRDPRPVDRPPSGPRSSTDEHGRGLLLVDRLAEDWGCVPTGDGKVMWAVLSLLPARP